MCQEQRGEVFDRFALKAVDLRKDPAVRDQLIYEAQVLRALGRNRHTVHLEASALLEGHHTLLLVMELGEEAFIDFLCVYQQHRSDMEHSFLRHYFAQMTRAVAFLHHKGGFGLWTGF